MCVCLSITHLHGAGGELEGEEAVAHAGAAVEEHGHHDGGHVDDAVAACEHTHKYKYTHTGEEEKRVVSVCVCALKRVCVVSLSLSLPGELVDAHLDGEERGEVGHVGQDGLLRALDHGAEALGPLLEECVCVCVRHR